MHAWGVVLKIQWSAAGVKEHIASAGTLGGRPRDTGVTFADQGVEGIADLTM